MFQSTETVTPRALLWPLSLIFMCTDTQVVTQEDTSYKPSFLSRTWAYSSLTSIEDVKQEDTL